MYKLKFKFPISIFQIVALDIVWKFRVQVVYYCPYIVSFFFSNNFLLAKWLHNLNFLMVFARKRGHLKVRGSAGRAMVLIIIIICFREKRLVDRRVFEKTVLLMKGYSLYLPFLRIFPISFYFVSIFRADYIAPNDMLILFHVLFSSVCWPCVQSIIRVRDRHWWV